MRLLLLLFLSSIKFKIKSSSLISFILSIIVAMSCIVAVATYLSKICLIIAAIFFLLNAFKIGSVLIYSLTFVPEVITYLLIVLD